MRRLQNDASDLPYMPVDLRLKRRQVVVAEWQCRSSQTLRYALWSDTEEQVRVEHIVALQIGSQILVVPAVAATKQHFVSSGVATYDSYCDRLGFTAALTVADHLSTQDGYGQFACKLDIRSRYSLPSRSQQRDPWPRRMEGGVRSGAYMSGRRLISRVPPGMRSSASRYSA